MARYDDLSDVELWEKTRHSDKAAFSQIYARYAPSLINHGYNKFRDREQARDYLQDIFITLWKYRETQKFSSTLRQFLYTAMRNKFLNAIKHKNVIKRYMDSMIAYESGEGSHADYKILEQELSSEIERTIAELPEKMREVFNLKRNYDLSYKEIAEMVGISEQTVGSHITNARKRMRTKFGFFICLLWML